MRSIVGLGLALTCLITTGWTQPAIDVEFRPDVVCGKGGATELRMDIAIPKGLTEPAPCVVVIHGGAWRGGDKGMHKNEIMSFARQGFVSASIQYRFCPADRFPAQVEDVKCAIRFLRANASTYNLDPKRIGAVGFSAGAHLAMMLGVMDKDDGLEGDGGWADQPSKVQAVVSFFGPTVLAADVIPPPSVPLVQAFIGGDKVKLADDYRRASPLTYVDAGDAPLLIFHGTKDRIVPHSQAVKMGNAMSKAGIDGRVELLLGADHGWGEPDRQRTIDATFRFFRRHLLAEE